MQGRFKPHDKLSGCYIIRGQVKDFLLHRFVTVEGLNLLKEIEITMLQPVNLSIVILIFGVYHCNITNISLLNDRR